MLLSTLIVIFRLNLLEKERRNAVIERLATPPISREGRLERDLTVRQTQQSDIDHVECTLAEKSE